MMLKNMLNMMSMRTLKNTFAEITFLNQSNEIVTEAIYRNDVLDKLIFTGVPVNGVLTQTINVPKYCTQLYIRRNNNLNFSSIVPIINGEASTTFTKTSSTKKTSATSSK
jgi:Tfp pilus assembly PilM family ATPase